MTWICATDLDGNAVHLNLALVRFIAARAAGGSTAVFAPGHTVDLRDPPGELLGVAERASGAWTAGSRGTEDARAKGADGRKSDRWTYANGAEFDRRILGLPEHGPLTVAQVEEAFRRAVKRAHPDVGGEASAFRRIAAARDALLEDLR